MNLVSSVDIFSLCCYHLLKVLPVLRNAEGCLSSSSPQLLGFGHSKTFIVFSLNYYKNQKILTFFLNSVPIL